MTKKYIIKLFLVLVIVLAISNVYALTPTLPTVTDPTSTITQPVKNLWATFSYVVQIIAVGCVVFAGVRYMFASSNQRADLKKGLAYLTIGSIIVFGAITVIQIVADII